MGELHNTAVRGTPRLAADSVCVCVCVCVCCSYLRSLRSGEDPGHGSVNDILCGLWEGRRLLNNMRGGPMMPAAYLFPDSFHLTEVYNAIIRTAGMKEL